MASSLSPISDLLIQPPSSSRSDRARRKRKKKQPPLQTPPPPPPGASFQRWRSEKQQQIYSTKLVQALRELRISQSPESSTPRETPRGGRAVREVADRALAVTARGRMLWSRALLASRSVKLKFRKRKRPRISNLGTAPVTGSCQSRKQRATVLRLKGKKSIPAVQRKVKVLSRLVPGCRKQPLPVVLEETTDYIAAMQMQIRAMTAILDAVGSSSAPLQTSPSPPPPPPLPPPAHDGEQAHMIGKNGGWTYKILSFNSSVICEHKPF
ncbi:PREDICTED: transcription factor bHLH147 [Tarenaya hassleriana]|uniref:transcription factor bHLH147 n=1 Tax=Tarenaya hassleriana TaxID=28532 RepID=UPI00053C2DFE|nr:PREDICTED: transcription factor bHLH147 [Tarenaya hassleriana]